MTASMIVFDEPELEFRYGQKAQDPHDGLSLFGSYDSDLPSHPKSMPYITIGTKSGIQKFNTWANALNRPVTDAPKRNYRLWPPFPGFEVAFNTKWPTESVWSGKLSREKLIETSRFSDAYERAFNVVGKYLESLKIANKRDENIGVAICIVPDEVWQNCRPQSRVTNPIGEMITKKRLKARKAGQLEMFSMYNPQQYQLSTDFRRQLKARAMEFDIPIQIIRESTLRLNDINPPGQRALTPLSDRMWNISTALYYKCGGKPWRLLSARDGVCYIGIVFRRTEEDTACCAAQMFLDSGDGIVFLGEYGPWYSPRNKQFHLTKSAARNLLEGILKTYRELGGKNLKEVFLHSRSTINSEEFEGYGEACPSNVKLVGIRVRANKKNSPRMHRTGNMPVVRGTFWKLSDSTGFLWGSGFKPRIATYDGWETPVPLRIDIQHGNAPIERIAQDILGLTKLNYNACKLGDSEPVTVGFSDAVGEILVSNPSILHRKPNFKFYI